MAALPSPTQVAGQNSAIYESYYNVVDPNGFGTVGAMEAARFLKKSGLSDVVLSRIWDLSDPGGRGCLDKSGMFVALKLVALAQAGKDINLANISLDMPPPKMGDVPLPKPMKPPPPTTLITSVPPAIVDWTVKQSEREKYDKLFDSLQPANGLIPGNKVKGVLMDSKLPMDTLGKIWDLADQDKDGMLDRHEFLVAMHLVYKALEKHAIPNTLPAELLPPPKRKDSALLKGLDGVKTEVVAPPPQRPPVAATAPTSFAPPPKPLPLSTPNWVITGDERAKADALFIKSDIDRDGFVSGQEIKDVFLQSGVPQPILAHIWALCDIKQSGKLNNEQFALAMWFVARCLKGIDPPPALTPEMVPPSFRNAKSSDVLENNNTPYSNPELDMISKDIEELSMEKLTLEAEITQKEADIKIKFGEIRSLQSELDTLAATLKQLENQKGEAQKRLNDLKAQKCEVDKELDEVEKEIVEHQGKVDKLRNQAAEQAEAVAAQEAELTSKKEQLEGLRQEEQRLTQQKNDSVNKLDVLTGNLQETQLNISQAKALITQLQEHTRQMNDAIVACDTALEAGDVSTVPDAVLRISPEFRDAQYTKVGLVNGKVVHENGFGDKEHDPFSSKSGSRKASAGFTEDPFKSDPFKSNTDTFNANDPFTSAFSRKTSDGFDSDPFVAFNNPGKSDPFGAFEAEPTPSNPPEDDKDEFGCDPFAALHAPTRDSQQPPGRPTSPSPALPPKKNKPPRPAPPRPTPPLGGKEPGADPFNDPFPADGGGGEFADFADFDAKFTEKPKPQKTLEFTDDPFRDYRYEDPFNIAFDDDDNTETNDVGKSAESLDAFEPKFDSFGLEAAFPSTLGDGRMSVPLPAATLRVVGGATGSGGGRSSAPLTKKLGEDEQLAWAAQESLKLEEARQRRHVQEQADLELALALSRAENPKV